MLFEKEVFSATLHKGMNIAAGTMTMWRRIEFVLLLFFCAYANVLLVTLTIFAMLCKRASNILMLVWHFINMTSF